MTTAREVLDRIPAARVERILVEVAAKLHLEVALYLKSGAVMHGRVIDARREGLHGTVLLEVGQKDDLLYVEMAAIDAVGVAGALEHAGALSFGALEDSVAGEAPERAELDAMAAMLARRTSPELNIEIVWEQIAPTEAARRSLAEALHDAGAAFELLTQDASGSAQLATIKEVLFEAGTVPSVERDGNILRVYCALDKGRAGRVDTIGLLTAIGATHS